jgi:hypothetical protein
VSAITVGKKPVKSQIPSQGSSKSSDILVARARDSECRVAMEQAFSSAPASGRWHNALASEATDERRCTTHARETSSIRAVP